MRLQDSKGDSLHRLRTHSFIPFWGWNFYHLFLIRNDKGFTLVQKIMDNFRGLIEKFSLFPNRSETLVTTLHRVGLWNPSCPWRRNRRRLRQQINCHAGRRLLTEAHCGVCHYADARLYVVESSHWSLQHCFGTCRFTVLNRLDCHVRQLLNVQGSWQGALYGGPSSLIFMPKKDQ